MKNFPCCLFKIAFLTLILAACVAVPQCKPLSPQSGTTCPDIFPDKAFRAIHKIEMNNALFGKSIFIGAAKVEPQRDALHAVLMSVEGMVLFEAKVEGGDLLVISAFPPLNDPDFTRELMADVLFLLLKPAAAPAETGADEQGLTACRWPTEAGGVLEQTLMREGAIRMRRYDKQRRTIKEAVALPPFDRGMPTQIRMRSFIPVNYTIELTLINMEFVD